MFSTTTVKTLLVRPSYSSSPSLSTMAVTLTVPLKPGCRGVQGE